tara:strand:+ start:46 stop:531 length:486 start_codon:yes stop_codon:yes gene_type:complete
MTTDKTAFEKFGERLSVEQVEEGNSLSPRFDSDNLIPAITTHHKSGEVLMLGYMNKEALNKTIDTGEAHYWSRSRNCLWRKGATSGLVQRVKEMRIDDDQDAIWIKVEIEGSGASCHVGYRSCFYREVVLKNKKGLLNFKENKKVFDPTKVYGDAPNPTKL